MIQFLLLFLLVADPQPGDQDICLSAEEKKLYDLIMDYRRSKKLRSIPFSGKLTKVAQAHVRDLMENFAYANRGDCNPHSWSDKGTWTPCCYTSDHKQAACMWNKPKEISGYSSDGFEIAFYSSDGAEAVESLEGWKSSPGHNPVIINAGTWDKLEWKAIGVGVYGNYSVVWFGAEVDPSRLTVCPRD